MPATQTVDKIASRLARRPAAASETVAEVLARRDLSNDGKINPVEFRLRRGPGADFGTFDMNHDGQLDAAELAAVLKAPAPAPPKCPRNSGRILIWKTGKQERNASFPVFRFSQFNFRTGLLVGMERGRLRPFEMSEDRFSYGRP